MGDTFVAVITFLSVASELLNVFYGVHLPQSLVFFILFYGVVLLFIFWVFSSAL